MSSKKKAVHLDKKRMKEALQARHTSLRALGMALEEHNILTFRSLQRCMQHEEIAPDVLGEIADYLNISEKYLSGESTDTINDHTSFEDYCIKRYGKNYASLIGKHSPVPAFIDGEITDYVFSEEFFKKDYLVTITQGGFVDSEGNIASGRAIELVHMESEADVNCLEEWLRRTIEISFMGETIHPSIAELDELGSLPHDKNLFLDAMKDAYETVVYFSNGAPRVTTWNLNFILKFGLCTFYTDLYKKKEETENGKHTDQ